MRQYGLNRRLLVVDSPFIARMRLSPRPAAQAERVHLNEEGTRSDEISNRPIRKKQESIEKEQNEGQKGNGGRRGQGRGIDLRLMLSEPAGEQAGWLAGRLALSRGFFQSTTN